MATTNSHHVNLIDTGCTAAGSATPDLGTEELFLQDGELYDSLFNEPQVFNGDPVYHGQAETLPFENYEHPLGPESISEGLSFEDTSSASWQNVSWSSFATNATSPWIGLTGNSYGFGESFGSVGFEATSPLAVSPHVFNDGGFGGCLDQTITCEPPTDYDHAVPITIPQPNHHRHRAHNEPAPTSSPYLDIPPILSTSPAPVLSSPKISALRKRSKSDPRGGRSNSVASSGSPRSKDYAWIQYQINKKTGKPVAYGSDKGGAIRTKGRTKGLSPEQRKEAALMRVLGACSNCRRRKEKCDPGIPCRACLDHYKSDLVHNPCRDTLLADLHKIFLSERLGWHPTSRSLTSCLGNNNFSILENTRYTIPLNLGFGPYLYLSIHPLQVHDHDRLIHRHVIYSWPPSTSTGTLHNHAVLPAILTSATTSTLKTTLDTHISLLITDHFNTFPLFKSQLSVLKPVYILYRNQAPHSYSHHLLHTALKLLVLVHIGGDITLPSPEHDITGSLAHILATHTPHHHPNTVPTPCFIRSQFGAVMPALAMGYMTDILSRVEKVCLSRNCGEWETVLAVFLLLMMTVESVQYHAAKIAYHASFDLGPGFANLEIGSDGKIASEGATSGIPFKGREGRELDEKGFETLRNFYRACFGGCHARLNEDWVGGNGSGSAEDTFVDSIRETMKSARRSGYLERKAVEVEGGGEGGDMRWFFDRLVARLLVLG